MTDTKRKTWRAIRLGKRIFKWVFYAAVAYVVIVLVGLIPVNNDFTEPNEGVTIFVVSNEVHADVIVPIKTTTIDWTEEFGAATFFGDVSTESHVAFGWGDKGFFLETETWDDFKLSIAANALLIPSESCMHVSYTRPSYFASAPSVTISAKQYEKLVDHIKQSFKKNADGRPVQISGRAYSTNDAFFEANGRYHLLNTCNSWVGRGLKRAGVKVPWLSSLPKTPSLYFESE